MYAGLSIMAFLLAERHKQMFHNYREANVPEEAREAAIDLSNLCGYTACVLYAVMAYFVVEAWYLIR